jgi:hypothetical protein
MSRVATVMEHWWLLMGTQTIALVLFQLTLGQLSGEISGRFRLLQAFELRKCVKPERVGE